MIIFKRYSEARRIAARAVFPSNNEVVYNFSQTSINRRQTIHALVQQIHCDWLVTSLQRVKKQNFAIAARKILKEPIKTASRTTKTEEKKSATAASIRHEARKASLGDLLGRAYVVHKSIAQERITGTPREANY